jgi:hypothetical protein
MPTVNFAMFNELSAVPCAESLTEATRWLADLVEVMKRAARLGFRRLRTRHDFRQTQMTAKKALWEVLSELDRDRRLLVYSLTQSPYLSEPDEPVLTRFLSYTVVTVTDQPCQAAEGLLSAHVADALAISFLSVSRWRVSEVRLELEHDLTRNRDTIAVRHASHPDHLKSHICWAARRTCAQQELVPSPGRPLPNTKLSDQLVNDDWDQFYRITSALAPAEKNAALQQLARDVAFVNGYNYSPQISSKNRHTTGALRQVFVSAFTRQGHEFYLSTDFEKPAGAFEVCDRNGRHLGEWLFSGKQNGDADRSGRHNLLVFRSNPQD